MLNWTKICRTCKEIKVAPEFDKDSNNSDGLESVCIRCSDLAYNNHSKLFVNVMGEVMERNKDLLDKLK